MTTRIGFIGLGIMGLPQAVNLVRAGHTVTGFNRSRPAVDRFVAAGGQGADSIAQASAGADIIITMLPDLAAVRAVILGKNGVADNARTGALVIDMSTISALEARNLHDALRARGLRMLDAPVSGGEPKAIDGTLSIMVGGDEADFAEALPVLRAMGGSVTRVGGIGSGNICKVCNQILVMANLVSVSEALTFAVKAGADPELVFQAVRGGLGASTILDAKGPMMLAGNIKPGGPLRFHIKDMINAFEIAMHSAMPMPLTATVREIIQSCLADGLADADHSSVIRYYEKLSGASIRKDR
jgi:2-hydroxy-3-oxopropionate reductase